MLGQKECGEVTDTNPRQLRDDLRGRAWLPSLVLAAISLLIGTSEGTCQVAEGGGADAKHPASQPSSQPKKPELPRELAEWVAGLSDAAEEEDRKEFIRQLLTSRNPAVLPALLEQLGKERPVPNGDDKAQGRERRLIVMGIVQLFPDRAFEVLRSLAREGNPVQRESATYGLGHVEDPEAKFLLLELLQSPEEVVRQAAAYSLLNEGREAALRANNHANHAGRPLQEEDLAGARSVVSMVVELTKSALFAPTQELHPLLRKMASWSDTRQLMDAFVESLPEEQGELGKFLTRASLANRRWLGRAQAPPVERIDYVFVMENMVSGKSKEFPVTFGPLEYSALRYSGQHLDRATHLELPLDALFFHPQACAPRWVSATAEEVVLRYRLPRLCGLTVSMGSMNISYWQSRMYDGREAEVVFDAVKGVPIREQIFGAGGKPVAVIDYGGYQALEADAWVPLEVKVEVLSSAQLKRHMSYELSFQVLEPGVWLYREGVAHQVTESGHELRALSSLVDVRVTPKLLELEAPPQPKRVGDPQDGAPRVGPKPTSRPESEGATEQGSGLEKGKEASRNDSAPTTQPVGRPKS